MKKKGGLYREWHTSDNNDGFYVSKNEILSANVNNKEYAPLNIDKIVNTYSSFGGKNKKDNKKKMLDNVEKLYLDYLNKNKSNIKSYFIKNGGISNIDTNIYYNKGLYVNKSDMTNTNGLDFNNNFSLKPIVYNKDTPQSSFSYSP